MNDAELFVEMAVTAFDYLYWLLMSIVFIGILFYYAVKFVDEMSKRYLNNCEKTMDMEEDYASNKDSK